MRLPFPDQVLGLQPYLHAAIQVKLTHGPICRSLPPQTPHTQPTTCLRAAHSSSIMPPHPHPAAGAGGAGEGGAEEAEGILRCCSCRRSCSMTPTSPTCCLCHLPQMPVGRARLELKKLALVQLQAQLRQKVEAEQAELMAMPVGANFESQRL